MSTLPIVNCPKDVWTDISGDMVTDTNYIVSSTGRASFVLSEAAIEPVAADSRFEYQGHEKQGVRFVTGVPFWVKPVGYDAVNIQIQEAF